MTSIACWVACSNKLRDEGLEMGDGEAAAVSANCVVGVCYCDRADVYGGNSAG